MQNYPIIIRVSKNPSVDAETWDRARGWALWKAAITLAFSDGAATGRTEAKRTLSALAESGSYGSSVVLKGSKNF